MNNVTHRKNEDTHPEVDGLLRDFFRAEMPHPWPALNVPRTTSPRIRRVGSFWGGTSARLALAACVTLLVAGYLTLSAFFPQRQVPIAVEGQGREIGQIEKSGTGKSDTAQHERALPMD